MKTLSLLALTIMATSAFGVEKPVVYAPVLPYQWLVQRVGGDWIEARVIVEEGNDPHDYSPSPKQIASMAEADLLLAGDLGFEGNFFIKTGKEAGMPEEIALLEGLDLLDGSCSECASGHAKEGEEGHEHHDHDHGELKDPHVWLSPKILISLAERLGGILKENTPEEASAEIDKNVAALREELETLDAELAGKLAPAKGRAFYVYHGAFAYFAQAYGLEQKPIEMTGRKPTPKQIAGIAKQAKEEGVKIIFVQPQFDQSSAASLAETIGGTVSELDPLEYDVPANLRKIAESIVSIRG